MNKIITLIASLLLVSSAYGNSIESDKGEMLERELRKLTNRIEILEHEIMLIKNKQEPSNPQALSAITEESTAAPAAVTPLAPVGSAAPISKEKQRYDLALSSLKDKDYEEAKEQFANFLSTYPKSSMKEKAMFWYSETFFRQNDHNNAALHYLKCYQTFPKGEKAQDSLLKLATSLSHLGRKTKVCQIIAMLEKDFPNRSAAAKKTANDLKVKDNCK
jgi:tol-pal system protein YbgF